MSAISGKSQITIPKRVLAAAGLAPGDDVQISSVGPGRIELVRSEDLVAEYAGIFDDTVYPPGYLEDLRREWE